MKKDISASAKRRRCFIPLKRRPKARRIQHAAISYGSMEVPVQIQLQPVATGLSQPVLLTNARDGAGRRYIVEQPGRIRVLQPSASQSTVFLDITGRVQFGGEQGLLGLTFHPQFAANRRFFVHYTRNSDGANVVSEYQVSSADTNVADLTEKVLMVIPQPFSNHNGGMIAFGPDGFLYIAKGDGGSGNDPGNRAQLISIIPNCGCPVLLAFHQSVFRQHARS